MARKKGKSLLEISENYCIIDLETTGLDSEYDEIIEIAAIRVRNGKAVATFSELVKPKYEIDEFIQKLTGITNEMVVDKDSIELTLPRFLDFVGKDIVAGHNVNFDINFIYDNSMKLTQKPFSSDYIDTLRLSHYVLPKLQHHRLKDLVEALGITNENAHRALSDCQATFQILQEFQKQIKEKKIVMLPSAKAYQIKTDKTEFDETNPLFGKTCVFTGTLERMSRREVLQLAVDLGARCTESVSSKTDFLILGNLEYASNMNGEKSNKLRKAEKLILEGKDIKILSENVFFDMIESE